MKDCKNKKETELLPFYIIKAASEGNIVAINKIVQHYEGYILTLSTIKMKDCYGREFYGVDETLRQKLELKLITTILKFKPVPYSSIKKEPK